MAARGGASPCERACRALCSSTGALAGALETGVIVFLDRELWPFTRGVRLRIALCVAVGVLAAATGIVRLGLLGWLLARVFTGAPVDELVLPFALVAAIMLLRGALEYGRTMIAHHSAASVQQHLRGLLYDKVTALGPAYFSRERTGEVLLSLVEGVEQLESYFGQYLPQFFVAAVMPLLIFGFVAVLDLPVALVLFAAALVTLIAPTAWHRMDRRKSIARQKSYAAFAAEFLDSIQGLVTLKAFGQGGARGQLLARKAHDLFKATMGVLGTNTLSRGITDTGIAVGAAAALGLGATRVANGTMELSALLIILMLGVEVFRPLRDLRQILHQGMNGKSAAEGILALLRAEPAVAEPTVAASMESAAARLEPQLAFDDVTFTYPGGRHPAHRGLGFSVAAGERVAIVGPSGAGKSTVIKLLLRFFDPDSGAVRLGGVDVSTLAQERLRGAIAVVNQDTYLFHGTVEDNLRMGRPEATQDELEAAARAANAHEFIAELPAGYGTVVGERGIRLSAGQRQRIAIARALLRNAPVLVLDEALSSVDAESEWLIQEALERLMEGRTTLVLAHRLSSVITCDRILVLEDGRLAESGTHQELMARNGSYHRLMASQVRAAEGGAAADDILDPAARSDATQAAAPDLPGTPVAALSEPTDAILRAEGMSWLQVIRVLLGMIAPWRGQLAWTFTLGVTRVAALIGVGVLSALIVLALKQGSAFEPYLIGLAIAAPLAGLLHWMESWTAHDMAYRLLGEMRIDMFKKLDSLAPAYFTHRRTGDLVAVATHDVEMVEYFFAHTIAPAFVALLVPAAVLTTLLVYGWHMAAALAPFLVFAALHPMIARGRIDRLGARSREALGDLNAHAMDSVQGLGEIVAFQQERRRGAEFADKTRAAIALRLPFFRDLTRQTVLQEIAAGLGGLAVVIAGTRLASAGALEPGMLPLLTILAMSAFLPVSEIAQVGRQLADTLGATRRVYAVHSEPVPVTSGAGVPARTARSATALELNGVTFSYPARFSPALDDVSFAVPAGHTIALVGASGAGKTTVANLMLRFWDPQQGELRLDGHDLRQYDLDDLRRRIALVAQDTHLFNDTLRHNILIARPDASEREVRDAVEKASLGEFVAGLPQGLDAMVGERGTQLSGGQRQRVTIARAFLKGAPILILDEATSHLDAVNEEAVRQALDRLKQNRTTVIIAHRLSTVRDADRIVVLDRGRVAEQGRHEALVRGGGLYARLIARQMAGATVSAA